MINYTGTGMLPRGRSAASQGKLRKGERAVRASKSQELMVVNRPRELKAMQLAMMFFPSKDFLQQWKIMTHHVIFLTRADAASDFVRCI